MIGPAGFMAAPRATAHEAAEEAIGPAHDALNKMRRAHLRGTGCHLTADQVFALSLTRIGELWADEDPRKTKGPK